MASPFEPTVKDAQDRLYRTLRHLCDEDDDVCDSISEVIIDSSSLPLLIEFETYIKRYVYRCDLKKIDIENLFKGFSVYRKNSRGRNIREIRSLIYLISEIGIDPEKIERRQNPDFVYDGRIGIEVKSYTGRLNDNQIISVGELDKLVVVEVESNCSIREVITGDVDIIRNEDMGFDEIEW